ncbi:MAG: D-alanyl-D-alanine carboxypeptidase/D-alanyl-D-alanine-endopeptidase [candidate division WOR-3 bacterium]|nr:MAG: D-alanyl-D-alanine carboxypeptidase/D-alanyl-D-alanine-endopeptidase [candidate division WOR-3 bacterium]
MLLFLLSSLMVDSIIYQPGLQHAQIGLIVLDLDKDSVVYAYNHDKLLVPASNVKILTSAAALVFLGPDFRYRTRIAFGGRLRNRRLQGNIMVFGRGDPNFSLSDVDSFVNAIKNKGISEIEGDIVLVDDYFTEERLPIGWSWHYLDARYAAEISALSVNRNTVNVAIEGTTLGEKARVVLEPETGYVTLVNNMVTKIGDDSIIIYRRPDANVIYVDGGIGYGRARNIEVAVKDPTMYFGEYLKERLRASDVRVNGKCIRSSGITQIADTAYTIIDSVISIPMFDIIKELNTESVNLFAEAVLKTLGAYFRRQGSFRAGVSILKEFMRRCGVDTNFVVLHDGSGLSRYNLMSPYALALILRRMYHSKYFTDFYNLLPGPGEGTIENRFKDMVGSLRAKTGTLDAISCLSGYLHIGGRYYCFSLMFNNFACSRKQIESIQEDLLKALKVYLEKEA